MIGRMSQVLLTVELNMFLVFRGNLGFRKFFTLQVVFHFFGLIEISAMVDIFFCLFLYEKLRVQGTSGNGTQI